MILTKEYKTDVLVVGAGLAGISASLEAAKSGASVILSVASNFCSGSSFYPGTWGLGMVAPIDETDKADFVHSIKEVGCGMADDRLSSILINNIGERIKELEEMGIKLKKPDNVEKDNTLIPCFDRKHRKWFGYLFDSAKEVFNKELKQLDITLMEKVEIIKLIKHNDNLSAAIGINENNEFICIYTNAVVLATGGFGGVYKHSLNTSDINGYGQVLALEAGCELINVEFMQFIPGFLKPGYKTVVNERSFKYSTLTDKNGKDILDKYLPNAFDKQVIMEERSGHGPFSSRLNSKYVDIAMFNEYLTNKDLEGIRLRYCEDIKNTNGLMIIDYFKWLKESKGIDINDEIFILPFEHAANGGIRINERAETNVRGIYAAGEVTGGMHGADRIGGLSTANALVFGKIAGKEAALFAKRESETINRKDIEEQVSHLYSNPKSSSLEPDDVIHKIKEIMWTYGSIIRDEKNLVQCINEIQQLDKEFDIAYFINNNNKKRNAVKAHNFIQLAMVLLNAMILRKESRGSHYRDDYPDVNNSYNKRIVISKRQDNELQFKWC